MEVKLTYQISRRHLIHLLINLFRYGIGGKTLKQIDSFLSYRPWGVFVNGAKSGWAQVQSDLDTVLGSLLFSLHIYNVFSDIDSEAFFTDSCICYWETKDKGDTLKFQKDISCLGYQAKNCGMRFQPFECRMVQPTKKKNRLKRSMLIIAQRELSLKMQITSNILV